MPEAVIVSAVRTPIGRAKKGSLLDVRPDDLAAFAVSAALKKVPEVDPGEVVDVIIGCGFPEQKQGMNLGRRVALLAGLPEHVPGVTVNRFCAPFADAASGSLNSASTPEARPPSSRIRSPRHPARISAPARCASSR